ncbi:acyltransferase family protein [Protaetiibacter mangrovi]|uniref:Acyltransferase n=1 Tax=Protaetiibacter mangrovi TaxID=2970926 RepID=A0ABT1ZFJ4_9MICO|nr:acyltransferase [Protaetiibacter mangrovi]MCS0499475.1 acyltransferase [Protaetiibacter mangrovi]
MRTLATEFDPRANSIGFVRWLMAFAVIFSHAGPIAGFYSGHDLGVQWSNEQSLGGVAVGGFFFLSGFLITKSRMGRSTTARFFWRRALRIFPAFWLALLSTAFVLAPIAWIRVHGSIDGFFRHPVESPLTYFFNNMSLILNQRNIAELGGGLPYSENWGARDWNGSAWTLAYEFGAYILVGILGLVGALAHRKVGAVVALGIIALSAVQWLGAADLARLNPVFGDHFILLLWPPFAFGILFALYGDRIPIDWRIAVAGLAIALYCYARGGYLVIGQYGFYYFLMWFAIRATLLRRWERFGDFSYGIYIFAWPIMTLATYFGLENRGWLVYHVVIVVACHIAAFLSWHLIEKPAMSLKNWTPRPVAWAIERWRALRGSIAARRVPGEGAGA